MQINWLLNLQRGEAEVQDLQVPVLAYADDTTYIARDKLKLEQILRVAEDFYKVNDIEINSKKSELLVLNAHDKHTVQEGIIFGPKNKIVHGKKAKDLTRFLGMWLSEKAEIIQAVRIAKEKVLTVMKGIKRKKASLAHMAYINNVVLLPQLEYRLQHCLLSHENCEKLQSSLLILIKNKVGMMKTTLNSTLTHQNIVGVKLIWQNQLAHHFTEITSRLNNKGSMG